MTLSDRWVWHQTAELATGEETYVLAELLQPDFMLFQKINQLRLPSSVWHRWLQNNCSAWEFHRGQVLTGPCQQRIGQP